MQLILLRTNGSRYLKFWQLYVLLGFVFFLGIGMSWIAHFFSRQENITPPPVVEQTETVDSRAITTRLGELQARLDQLDVTTARLNQTLGLKKQAHHSKKDNPAVAQQDMNTHAVLGMFEQQATKHKDHLAFLEKTLTQKAVKALSQPQLMPVHGFYTSGFGFRVDPFTKRLAFHKGIDLAAPRGTPVVAAAHGIISETGKRHDYGLYVDINHGNATRTRYAHLDKIFTKTGEFVRKGQQIGAVGRSGRATGFHVHFETYIKDVAVNPRTLLNKNKTIYPLDPRS